MAFSLFQLRGSAEVSTVKFFLNPAVELFSTAVAACPVIFAGSHPCTGNILLSFFKNSHNLYCLIEVKTPGINYTG